MEDKFLVEVFLVLASIDIDQRNQSQFLVLEEGENLVFPSLYLNKSVTTRDLAIKLLKDYSGVTTDWAILLPFGIVDDIDPDKDSISVLYGVFIPGVTRIRKDNSRWISYQDLESNPNISSFTKKLAYEAIWRQV